MPEITIEVGELHASLDEQMREMLEDRYAEAFRQEAEDFIHDTYRQIERAQEQQEGEDVAEDIDLEDDE